jgi:uncharacterized membrane protein YhaH (DUF805 family)
LGTIQYSKIQVTREAPKQMLNSVKSTFRQYATFYGREDRRTYLNFVIFQVITFFLGLLIVVICWYAAGLTLNDASSNQHLDTTAWLSAGIWGLLSLGVVTVYTIFLVASLVPYLALQSRRLHDANFSAWWLLLHLVPVGTLALFIMNCFNSVHGDSMFENEGRPRNRVSASERTPITPSYSSDEW